jgi:hypothetical protein
LLQEQFTRVVDMLAREQARGEKQAAAFVEVARTCDNCARELEAQYATKFAQVAVAHDAVVAAKDATVAGMERLFADLEASHAATAGATDAAIADMKDQLTKLVKSQDAAVVALHAAHASDAAAKDACIEKLEQKLEAATAIKDATIFELRISLATLKATHAADIIARDVATAYQHANLETDVAALKAPCSAVTSKSALDIHPLRCDHRQFSTLHVGPVPGDEFDTAWCAAACGGEWEVDIDPATRTRAHVTCRGESTCLTLRGAAPLPRRVLSAVTASPQQQLPSYRVIIEGYSQDCRGFCYVGLVPSCGREGAGTEIAATAGDDDGDIYMYGGWRIRVCASLRGSVHTKTLYSGWTVMHPCRDGAGDGDCDTPGDTSAYATTDEVPPVPPGGAVELAVDYAAGTCRVAFYTPEAVAGGFVEPPHAKMELRFVATEAAGRIPARSVPTADAGSGVQLYPAMMACGVGAIWRFAAR